MAVDRYTASFKTKTNVLSNITPSPVLQENAAVPAGPWMPAAWLPVEWSDTVTGDYFVISSGKVVAKDITGRIVPAGYRIKLTAGTIANDWVVYTATDVTAGTIDITTGEAVTTAVSYGGDDVAEAILERGLVHEGDLALGHNWAKATGADCLAVLQRFVGYPVGVVLGDVYAWAGDWPDLNFANYQKQHLIAYVNETQMKVPHLVSASHTEDVQAAVLWATGTDHGTMMPDADMAGHALYSTAATLSTLIRYDGVIAATDTVVGIFLPATPVAKNTTRTPITSSSTLLSNEVTSAAKISAAGDWWLDEEVGMLLVYSADGATNPAGAGETVTFYYYASSGASAHRYVVLDGVAYPGDFVTYDALSNFVVTSVSASTVQATVMGRVDWIVREPVGLLDRVQTAWNVASMPAGFKMPGTATSGYSDMITLPGNSEDIADQVAYLTIKIQ